MDGFGKFRRLVRRAAALALLARRVDLEEARQRLRITKLAPDPIQTIGDLRALDRVHACQLRHLAQLPYLVRLQTADEVPPQALDVLRRFCFFGELLHVVLPKIALARVEGRLHMRERFQFGDGDERRTL